MADPHTAPRTVADLVFRAAADTPHRPAIIDGRRRLSWAELATATEELAIGLRGAGLNTGDRVLAQLPTGLELVEVYLACMRAGLVFVPINPTYTLPELRSVLADSGARALVTSSVDALTAAAELKTDPVQLVISVVPGSNAATPPDGTRSLIEIIEAGAPATAELPPVDSENVAVLLYTSGTSGRPKGAMLSHRALLANIAQGRGITPAPASEVDVVLLPIPLFHVYGLNAGLGIVLAQGAAAVLVDRFEVTQTLELIAEEHVSVVLGAPAMFAAWSRAPDFARRFAGVRFALSGSAALSPGLVSRYWEIGVALHEGYGLTEAAPVVTSNAGDRAGNSRVGRPKAGSVGAPLPGVEISLRDPSGEPSEDDDPGLVAVRGPNLFSGYWPDGAGGPDAEGWFVTGDLGYLDDDGDLILVGRTSDLVIVNGFNVYPAEIEAVFTRLDGVAAAAVVGEPDETTGEAVVAYVVPRPGRTLTAETLLTAAADSLARFKLPRRVEIVDTLPYTVTGKVQKWLLHERRKSGT